MIVFGSQAILGSFDDSELPDEAIGSIELDVCFHDDPSVWNRTTSLPPSSLLAGRRTSTSPELSSVNVSSIP